VSALSGDAVHGAVKKGSANAATFVLTGIELFNWGPFEGMHQAAIDPAGTAIIGPTGSGKTTLIDGLMTLLVPQPRYNLASTGGHESDRTLISYVRGVLGGDGATAQEEVARPGKTISGLCATYSNGTDELKLGGVLWTEGTSNAAPDLKRRWIFSTADRESLEQWLRFIHEEGVRSLMRHGRETGQLRVFENKSTYLAHTRKFFDVSVNAFTLLNRAAGLKQLNSIDEIFRELVLDDRAEFDRALEVAGEFDNLADIHAELETAERQQMSLKPIELLDGNRTKALERATTLRTLDSILPIWVAIEGKKRWAAQAEQLAQDAEHRLAGLQEVQQREDDCSARVDALHEAYLRIGGKDVGDLEQLIERDQADVAERSRHAEEYQRCMRQFDLDDELSESMLNRNIRILTERQGKLRTDFELRREASLETRSQLRDVKHKATDLAADQEKVRARPGSNIPSRHQDFRALLGEHLEMTDAELPFVAELVEVKEDERPWRGAIERAIGPERLRLIVSESLMPNALQWVSNRDNRLHVRLQEAKIPQHQAKFFEDGFTRKLNYKAHSYREVAKALLAKRDRHCVDGEQTLRATEHAMTIKGLMSDRSGRFEKQDQRAINQDWFTGFDNRDQLSGLAAQLTVAREEVARYEQRVREEDSALAQFDAQLAIIGRIVELDFMKIDAATAEALLENHRARLSAKLTPDSDTSKAKATFEAQRQQLKSIRTQGSAIARELTICQKEREDAERQQYEAEQVAGDGLSEANEALAKRRISIGDEVLARELPGVERRYRELISDRRRQQDEQIHKFEQQIVRYMGQAQRVDTGALAETGTEIGDVPDYLERLRVLTREALPEKRGRFLDYLNRSSDQGVTQLLAGIAEEVDRIEHRIAELNVTLAKVDFRGGRYLQLQPQRIRHERIRSLETAQRRLRSAALIEDNDEAHFKALRTVVDILREAGQNRRQLGSRALLDPRYRLQFFVVEVDRTTGVRSTPRTGSQSGSGGEKELMASHILTASLSYALSPTGADRPLYGTVVLDEAFSKSSPSAAARIIDALRIFGLHPIFVTPNKELSLLKKHTRKVICVQRPGKSASLASISWEKLDALSRQVR
jgi:uncharacterized protein YPO0396